MENSENSDTSPMKTSFSNALYTESNDLTILKLPSSTKNVKV